MEEIKLGEYIGPQIRQLFRDPHNLSIKIRNNEGTPFYHNNNTTHNLLHVSDLAGPSSGSIQLYTHFCYESNAVTSRFTISLHQVLQT
jgi:hypothetical protein